MYVCICLNVWYLILSLSTYEPLCTPHEPVLWATMVDMEVPTIFIGPCLHVKDFCRVEPIPIPENHNALPKSNHGGNWWKLPSTSATSRWSRSLSKSVMGYTPAASYVNAVADTLKLAGFSWYPLDAEPMRALLFLEKHKQDIARRSGGVYYQSLISFQPRSDTLILPSKWQTSDMFKEDR